MEVANVRRQLRTVLERAGIDGVTPHMFRRTVANEQESVDLAAQLLGHADPKVIVEHYIRRHEHVNPLTAELLDQRSRLSRAGRFEVAEGWGSVTPLLDVLRNRGFR